MPHPQLLGEPAYLLIAWRPSVDRPLYVVFEVDMTILWKLSRSLKRSKGSKTSKPLCVVVLRKGRDIPEPPEFQNHKDFPLKRSCPHAITRSRLLQPTWQAGHCLAYGYHEAEEYRLESPAACKGNHGKGRLTQVIDVVVLGCQKLRSSDSSLVDARKACDAHHTS